MAIKSATEIFRSRVPGPLGKQIFLIQREFAVLDRHSDKRGIDGLRHRPAEQRRRSVEAFSIGLADNASVMDDDDRAHARSLENRIVQRRLQATIIRQLHLLAGGPERVWRRQRRQWRRGGSVLDFVFKTIVQPCPSAYAAKRLPNRLKNAASTRRLAESTSIFMSLPTRCSRTARRFNHRIRVAFRDEYVRADCFCRIGGDELQRFRTHEGEPAA